MITSGDADSEAQSHGAEGGSDPHQLLSRLPEPTQRRMKPTDFSHCLEGTRSWVSPAAFLQMLLTLTWSGPAPRMFK